MPNGEHIEDMIDQRVSALEYIVRDQQEVLAGLIDILQQAELIEVTQYDLKDSH